VLGAVFAIAAWFVLWYPNFAALPLPSQMHSMYQGFLPTYLYPFQFAVNRLERVAPSYGNVYFLILGGLVLFATLVVGWSAWSWRIALAERRRDAAAATTGLALGAE
jgi:hypothetical protein